MTGFECESCGKKFKYNKNLTYHRDNNACKQQDYSCKYCGKLFTMKSSMYRHMRESCPVKKEDDDEKTEIFSRLVKLEESNKELQKDNKRLLKLEDENKKLKKEVKNLAKQCKGTTNNSNAGRDVNINQGTVNNHNHITLVAYGSEDLSKLDKTELLKIFRNGYDSTLKLTEVVHFNPKHPEYHNIYITNMKDKYAMMFDGTNWTLTIKDDLINRIYDDKKNYIEENLEEFIASLTPSQKRALDRWANTDEEDEKIRMIKERIKLLLYNSRNIPIETQRIVSEENKIKLLRNKNDIVMTERKKNCSKKIIKDG